MCRSNDANTKAKQMPNSACNGSVNPCEEKKKTKCTVQFRPLQTWQGEYGFDWMRIGDTGEIPYRKAVSGGYKGKDPTGKVLEHTPAEAYRALKNEYKTITPKIKSEPENLFEYFVPYLNLYPKNTPGTPTPPFEAKLRIKIAIEETSPDRIELEYDKTLFTLDKELLNDKAVGPKRDASDKTIKITCIKEYGTDQSIKVWAYPQGWKSRSERLLAGQLIVCKNSKSEQKEVKFVLVNVKTKINKVENVGATNAVEKQNLSNTLFQAFIYANMEDGPELDLRNDPHFKIMLKNGKTKRGKFIDPTNPVLNEDKDGFFEYVKAAFFGMKDTAKYKSYFTVFVFGEGTYDNTLGQVQRDEVKNVFVKNVVLFLPRDNATLNHEALHGLGVQHTHRDGVPEPERKYTFTKKSTNNIMEYLPAPFSTWHWQWEIMRKNV